MLVKIRGLRCAQTQRMHLRMAKAKQIVEHHWTEWLAQLYESLRWTVQIAAFVRRADDEDAHIALSSGFNRSPVVLKDVVPVNIHIVEQVAFNGVDNHLGRTMGREANMTNFALCLSAFWLCRCSRLDERCGVAFLHY